MPRQKKKNAFMELFKLKRISAQYTRYSEIRIAKETEVIYQGFTNRIIRIIPTQCQNYSI